MLTSGNFPWPAGKSMMTSPSEITEGNRGWPLAGLTRLLARCLFIAGTARVSIWSCVAGKADRYERASAAIKPDLAAAFARSFRFMELVSWHHGSNPSRNHDWQQFNNHHVFMRRLKF